MLSDTKIRHVILMLSGADICTQSFGIDPSFRIKLLTFSKIFKIQHITDPHLCKMTGTNKYDFWH